MYIDIVDLNCDFVLSKLKYKMERLQIEEAFITLKPLCDSLMKNPSIKIACEIANILPKISDKVITDLFEYIIFPFIIHLSNDKLR